MEQVAKSNSRLAQILIHPWSVLMTLSIHRLFRDILLNGKLCYNLTVFFSIHAQHTKIQQLGCELRT